MSGVSQFGRKRFAFNPFTFNCTYSGLNFGRFNPLTVSQYKFGLFITAPLQYCLFMCGCLSVCHSDSLSVSISRCVWVIVHKWVTLPSACYSLAIFSMLADEFVFSFTNDCAFMVKYKFNQAICPPRLTFSSLCIEIHFRVRMPVATFNPRLTRSFEKNSRHLQMKKKL